MAIFSAASRDRSTGDGIDVAMRVGLNGPGGPFELDIELQVAAGSFTALTGPSGSGKTTLLRLLAGLSRPASGYLRVNGETWVDSARRFYLATRRRPIGFVFQDYALFPNMTVRRHIEYAIGSGNNAIDIDELLQLAGLTGLADAYPERLSGGQRQRLALIRALARRPSLLMLDEPLSALDPAMRTQLQHDIRELHRNFATTTILVSHDRSEILRLADRVIRLEHGRVTFDGAPNLAFGLHSESVGVEISAVHVSGPDATGYAQVLIDGETRKLRYRNAPALERGDDVRLRFTDADAFGLRD